MKVRETVEIVVPVAMLVTALVCRAGEDDARLAFLWCLPGFDQGTVERRIEEANFSVKLATYWDDRPKVEELESRFGFEKHARYRFMGPGKTQWLSIEYMRLDKETPVAKDIAHWINAGLLLKGRIDLIEPDGVTFETLSQIQLPMTDSTFLKKHKADMMCLHLGTIKIGDMYHRFFIVCLNRGRESWKIVKVFPVHPPEGCTEKEACKFTGSDLAIAGLFIGNFRILSKERLIPYPDSTASVKESNGGEGERLLSAIQEKDLARVKEYLENGGDANYRGARGLTPLGAAIGDLRDGPDPEIVSALLEKGADPNRLWGNCGTTPFFSLVQNSTFGKAGDAAFSNKLAAVKLMLKHGADPNKEQGLFRKSALGYAVIREGDIELVKALVEGGANITDKMIDQTQNDAIKMYLLQHRQDVK